MKRLFAHAAVIARRDFLATVATPTFIVFLLAPLFMISIGVLGGTGAATLANNNAPVQRIVAIAPDAQASQIKATDSRLRALYRGDEAPPPLDVVAPIGDVENQADALLLAKPVAATAVLFGPLDHPTITFTPPSDRHARYLAMVAESTVLGVKTSAPATLKARASPASSASTHKTSGFGAVFGIFFLTLMLAGQSVGMLAEEKSNKVIEILAAAVPLEAVFLGKLIGMFGVALLFVSFWGVIGGIAVLLAPASLGLSGFSPAIGLPLFFALCAAYFAMAYMLLGAVFLGIGAQASSIREIQMMSLPITIFQMAMFGLSSAAAGSPGSRIAYIAEIFPFSSPFAMAARGASNALLWPHLLALAWQALWVALTIYVSARLFRMGVLKSGGGWRALLGLRAKA